MCIDRFATDPHRGCGIMNKSRRESLVVLSSLSPSLFKKVSESSSEHLLVSISPTFTQTRSLQFVFIALAAFCRISNGVYIILKQQKMNKSALKQLFYSRASGKHFWNTTVTIIFLLSSACVSMWLLFILNPYLISIAVFFFFFTKWKESLP